jgi:hypothetical protein
MDVDTAKASEPTPNLGQIRTRAYARLKRIHGRRWQGAIRYSSGRHPARHITSPGAGIGPLARALCWSIMVQHPMRTTKRHRHNYATSFIVAVVPKGVCALAHAAPSHQFVRRSADRCSGYLSCAGDGERRLRIGSGLCANALSRARTFGPRFRGDFVLRARAGRGVNGRRCVRCRTDGRGSLHLTCEFSESKKIQPQ